LFVHSPIYCLVFCSDFEVGIAGIGVGRGLDDFYDIYTKLKERLGTEEKEEKKREEKEKRREEKRREEKRREEKRREEKRREEKSGDLPTLPFTTREGKKK
jgi:hypothetical protein